MGRLRFEAETGIREADWIGRYWARWSEAVQEAGFAPNSLQGKRLDDEEMLARLAAFTHELGRIPTTPEIRMRKQAEPDFPNDKTFRTRFGGNVALVARLAAATEGSEDFADVHQMCLDRLASAPGSASDVSEATDVRSGFVYLVRHGRYHKIGRSNSVGRREYELAIQLPEKLTMIHHFETDDPEGIERYWHERFATKRANGEWFQLTKRDVADFKRRKRFM